MKLSTRGTVVAAGVPGDGPSGAAVLLGTAGATSGRRAEVATPPYPVAAGSLPWTFLAGSQPKTSAEPT